MRASSGLVAVPEPLFRASNDSSRGGVAGVAPLVAARQVGQADVPRLDVDKHSTLGEQEMRRHSAEAQPLSVACASEGLLARSPGLAGGGLPAAAMTSDMAMPASSGRAAGASRPPSRLPSSSSSQRGRGVALGRETGGARSEAADSADSALGTLAPGVQADARAADAALVPVRTDALAELHDALAGSAQARTQARVCRWELLVTAALGRRAVELHRWAAVDSADGHPAAHASTGRARDWVVERTRRAAEAARSAAAEAVELEQYYEASLRAAAMHLTSQLPVAALTLAKATREAEVYAERGVGAAGATWLWHGRGTGRRELGDASTSVKAAGGIARPTTPTGSPAGAWVPLSPTGGLHSARRPLSARAPRRPGSTTSRPSIPAAPSVLSISGISESAVGTYVRENLLMLGSTPAASPGGGGGGLYPRASPVWANGLLPSPPAARAPHRPTSSRLQTEKNPAFRLAPDDRPVVLSLGGQCDAASAEPPRPRAGGAPTVLAVSSGGGATDKRPPRAAARVQLGLAAGAAVRQTQMQMPELSALQKGTRPTSARAAWRSAA